VPLPSSSRLPPLRVSRSAFVRALRRASRWPRRLHPGAARDRRGVLGRSEHPVHRALGTGSDFSAASSTRRCPRLDWATLLRRTFDVDVEPCLGCGGRMTVRAVVTDAAAIARLLGARVSSSVSMQHVSGGLEPAAIAERDRERTERDAGTSEKPGPHTTLPPLVSRARQRTMSPARRSRRGEARPSGWYGATRANRRHCTLPCPPRRASRPACDARSVAVRPGLRASTSGSPGAAILAKPRGAEWGRQFHRTFTRSLTAPSWRST
jgi:hypothetical protein